MIGSWLQPISAILTWLRMACEQSKSHRPLRRSSKLYSKSVGVQQVSFAAGDYTRAAPGQQCFSPGPKQVRYGSWSFLSDGGSERDHVLLLWSENQVFSSDCHRQILMTSVPLNSLTLRKAVKTVIKQARVFANQERSDCSSESKSANLRPVVKE